MKLPLVVYLPRPLLYLFDRISSIATSRPAFWYTLPLFFSRTRIAKSINMHTFPYWILPIIAGVFWSGMLATFMIYWQTTGQPHYSSMDSSQSIPYISDIGAFRLKPLFIAGAAITTLCVDLSLVSERWLRHRGQLARNFTQTEKRLSIASIVCGVIGGLGLLFLSIFDTADYGNVHNVCLFVFMAGYVASATCSCWEYQSLGARGRDQRILRVSFWIKLVFIIVQVCLAIAFVGTLTTDTYNAAAVLEWVLAFVFGIYVFSYAIDLFPAARSTKSKPVVDVESK
ncbi:Frag1/DRAM/Sfk1 family-domain-containing protein [Cadophora sp. MPI-SDFR-AT-0126]|nr:Frag1/DRAM/Sfk1 family-domain-containing protein [Leotiomycetes sp. MPI-SDFR-AT-0126]